MTAMAPRAAADAAGGFERGGRKHRRWFQSREPDNASAGWMLGTD